MLDLWQIFNSILCKFGGNCEHSSSSAAGNEWLHNILSLILPIMPLKGVSHEN